MRRYLVVGNQTLQSARLLQELRDCTVEEPSRFHLVVPATPARDHAFWTEGEALSIARTRLRAALDALHREGLIATGEVGDANATAAIGDALRRQPSDEVIVSTLPPGISRWIHQDLPRRIARRVDVPVRHVVVELEDAMRSGTPELGRRHDADLAHR